MASRRHPIPAGLLAKLRSQFGASLDVEELTLPLHLISWEDFPSLRLLPSLLRMMHGQGSQIISKWAEESHLYIFADADAGLVDLAHQRLEA